MKKNLIRIIYYEDIGFLYEIIAKVYSDPKNKFMHIMYEEYYRLSNILFKLIPIVVTFHQPPKILKNEITKGNFSGRVMGFLHKKLIKIGSKKFQLQLLSMKTKIYFISSNTQIKNIHFYSLGLNFNY